jgi:hypothetical protein
MGIEATSAFPELLREHADDKTRRTVSALGSSTLRHRTLGFAKRARFREGFDRVYLATGRGGKRNQAAVDGLISGTIFRGTGSGYDKEHRAGTAFTFGATLLRAGESTIPDVIQKRGLGSYSALADKVAIQDKLKSRYSGPHAEFYRTDCPLCYDPEKLIGSHCGKYFM